MDPNTYGSSPYVAFGYPMSMTSGRDMELYPYRHVARGCDVEDVVIQGRGKTPHPIHIHRHMIHVNHGQVGVCVGVGVGVCVGGRCWGS